MKKLYNSIGAIALIFTCCMICISHIANKFFQEDLGNMVMSELRLEEQITTLFDQADGLVTPANEEAFLNLKQELINNEDVKKIIGNSTQEMMDDIVGNGSEYQDMKLVLKEIIHSYDNEIQTVAGDDISSETITSYVDQVIETLPIQEAYNETILVVKDNIPESYSRILGVVNLVSKKSVMIGSIVVSILIAFILILSNRKQMKWLFPVGAGLLGSGLLLFAIGGILPIIYQGMLQRLSRVLTSLTDVDFIIITYYAIGYTMIAVLCMVSHVLYQKVKQ